MPEKKNRGALIPRQREMTVRYRGRGSQVWIYFGKMLRMFVYQSDWKVIPMSALIAGLVGFVIRSRMFLNMDRIALVRFGNQVAEFGVVAGSILVGKISDGFKIQIFKDLVQGITQVCTPRVIRDVCNRSILVVIYAGLHQCRSVINHDAISSAARFDKVFTVSAVSVDRDFFVVNEFFAGFKHSLFRSQA